MDGSMLDMFTSPADLRKQQVADLQAKRQEKVSYILIIAIGLPLSYHCSVRQGAATKGIVSAALGKYTVCTSPWDVRQQVPCSGEGHLPAGYMHQATSGISSILSLVCLPSCTVMSAFTDEAPGSVYCSRLSCNKVCTPGTGS